MKTNARSLALILGLVSTVLTGVLLKYFGAVGGGVFWLLLLIEMALVYGVFYLTLQQFVFKDIIRITHTIPSYPSRGADEIDPISNLDRELDSYFRQTKQEIEAIQKNAAFRREFIADISHELKTPLFAAQGFVHTLLDGAVKDKSVRERFLKKAAKNLDGLDMLVQDLLSLSQIETGNIKVHHEYFDLYELILEVFEQFESRSQKKDIDLLLKIGGEVASDQPRVVVYADSRLMYQVISNLVSNGIKYSKSEGHVEVNLVDHESEIEVIVKDQGIGIPEKHQPRIFERFYRVEKSRSKIKDKGGTGLGLAIVKHILEAHHIKILVESTVGKGSQFSFRMPKDPARKTIA